MPDPPRRWQRWILALVLASYLTTASFATHYGYSVFLWDDSEYVAEALDTADHITSFGLPSWLGYVVSAQHYAKPPLYVNLLALFIHLAGRARTPLAVGLLAAVSSGLLGIAVFELFKRGIKTSRNAAANQHHCTTNAGSRRSKCGTGLNHAVEQQHLAPST